MSLSIMTNTYYRENQHNDIQHIDAQHNDKQHDDTQHNDTQHNDIQHIDAQHNDKQHNDTQPNDSQPIDTCLTLGQMTIRIMKSGIKKITNKFMFTECHLFYHYSEWCYSDQYYVENINADCHNTKC